MSSYLTASSGSPSVQFYQSVRRDTFRPTSSYPLLPSHYSVDPVMLNSLLALLNSRDNMRSKISGETPVSINLSRLATSSGMSSFRATNPDAHETCEDISTADKEVCREYSEWPVGFNACS